MLYIYLTTKLVFFSCFLVFFGSPKKNMIFLLNSKNNKKDNFWSSLLPFNSCRQTALSCATWVLQSRTRGDYTPMPCISVVYTSKLMTRASQGASWTRDRSSREPKLFPMEPLTDLGIKYNIILLSTV